jgi:MFS family permease
MTRKHLSSDESPARPAVSFSSEWRGGWSALTAGAIGVGLGFGLFTNVAGLFILPMQEALGWSRAAVAIGPIAGLGGSLLSPFVGALVDRYGVRLFALLGLVALGSAYLLLACVPNHPSIFYVVVLYLSLAGSIANAMVYVKGVATWFTGHTALAVGLMMIGLSISSAIVVPILSLVIRQYSWRWGFVTLTALVALIGLPVVHAWFNEHPTAIRERAVTSSAVWKNAAWALRDQRFWLLLAFLGFAALSVGAFMSQLHPVLIGHHILPRTAAALISFYAVAAGVGRISTGALLDLGRPTRVAAIYLVLAAIGAILLRSPVDTHSLSRPGASVFLLGLAHGAEVDFMAFFTIRLFGLQSFAVLYGMLNVMASACLGIGGIVFARLYDVFGNYDVAIALAGGSFCCAAAIVLMLRVPATAPNEGEHGND